ncbi:hypothetical protein pipiens_007575 [Culex pipiens pipiens]|uniref:NADH dehydrogenase [ubiquinone] 1 beta subcomplex subunit 7 n=1 Tax=Culex pipiens pipiens TaxID=38569 RepID=A0ABD1DKR6_CULPP
MTRRWPAGGIATVFGHLPGGTSQVEGRASPLATVTSRSNAPATMGNWVSRYVTNPDGTPVPLTQPSFDPNFGFAHARKERVMIATEEEMEAAKVPLADRDYCAHKLIAYRACRADVWPWAYKCAHEKHDYLNCEYEE